MPLEVLYGAGSKRLFGVLVLANNFADSSQNAIKYFVGQSLIDYQGV